MVHGVAMTKWIGINKSIINMDKVILIDMVAVKGMWELSIYFDDNGYTKINNTFDNEKEAMKLYDFFAEKLLGKKDE